MNGNIPQSPAPSSTNNSAGTILAICSLILFIAGIVLSFIPAVGIIIGIPFFLIALILSILAIVRGATVFGIIMLCTTVLLSGPTACFASCVGNGAAVLSAGTVASAGTFDIEAARVKKEINGKTVSKGAIDEEAIYALLDQSQDLKASTNSYLQKQLQLAEQLQKAVAEGDTAKEAAIRDEMAETGGKAGP